MKNNNDQYLFSIGKAAISLLGTIAMLSPPVLVHHILRINILDDNQRQKAVKWWRAAADDSMADVAGHAEEGTGVQFDDVAFMDAIGSLLIDEPKHPLNEIVLEGITVAIPQLEGILDNDSSAWSSRVDKARQSLEQHARQLNALADDNNGAWLTRCLGKAAGDCEAVAVALVDVTFETRMSVAQRCIAHVYSTAVANSSAWCIIVSREQREAEVNRFAFFRNGTGGWTIQFEDEEHEFQDGVGFAYIHALLVHPNHSSEAWNLEGIDPPPEASRQEALDREAIKSLKGSDDPEVQAHLQQHLGFGWRPKALHGGEERQKSLNRVKQAITRAREKIRERMPNCGEHLKQIQTTGAPHYTCTYSCASPPRWLVED